MHGRFSLCLACFQVFDLHIVFGLNDNRFLHVSNILHQSTTRCTLTALSILIIRFIFLIILIKLPHLIVVLILASLRPFSLFVHLGLHICPLFPLQPFEVSQRQIDGQRGQIFEKLASSPTINRLVYLRIYDAPQGCFLTGPCSMFRVQKAKEKDMFGVVAAVRKYLRMLKVGIHD